MSTARTRRPRPGPRSAPRTGSFGPVHPVPVPRPTGGTQSAMFGPDPAPAPRPERRADRGTADVEQIAGVVRLAIEPGYLLIGPAERVVRRDDTHPDHAAPIPTYEADTVAQLLDSGHLTTGGTRHVTCDNRTGPARAVLVPARTRHQLDRWRTTHVTKGPR